LAVVARDEAQGPPEGPRLEGLQPLLDLVADDMAAVNRIILDKAVSDVELIPKLAHHLIDSGGKRLRPMLTIAAARLCGYDGAGHIRLAAAVEFMHTATLLHDDVVDDSDVRRGKQSARLIWGNQASVLVGDFLLGQAFRMMVDVGSLAALGILSNAAAVIAEGEVMQLAAAKDTATTEDDYLAIITAKTAALFSAATEVGPAIAGRPADEQAALRDYGLNLGIAFQLVDDALDYAGDSAKLGKSTGDDFREGKITLPVIVCVSQGSAEERAFWKRTLTEGAIESGDLERAVAIMRRHGAIEATLDRARAFGALARTALASLPPSLRSGPPTRALDEVVGFCISRAA
jgi:octaprenyl-diphosphate synthase